MPNMDICRLCLFETPTIFPIMKNNADKMLESLTSIKLDPNDAFLMICLKCNLNLKLAYTIQQNIIKTDKKLKSGFVNSTKIKQEVDALETEEITIDEDGVKPIIKNNFLPLCGSICVICNLTLNDHSINLHIKQHFDNVQACDKCNQAFPNIFSYRQHLLTHSQYALHQCDKCSLKFYYKSLYNIHMEKVHSKIDKNPPVLLKPKQSGKSKEGVNEESVMLQRKYDVRTKLRQKPAPLLQQKAVPARRKEDSPVSLTCDICSKEFTTKKQFQNHTHKRKTCPICKKEITADNFSKHVKNHSSGTHICEYCGKTYPSRENLRDHVLYKHTNKRYECLECKITFNNRHTLSKHKKREHMGTRHICETCGREFLLAYNLSIHIKRTHLKVRSYICEFCKRGFSGLHGLKTHRRQHTNETPYKCEVCGDGFRQNVSLKAHLKSKHNIVEPITCHCKVCGKGFGSMHAVKAHMRCH